MTTDLYIVPDGIPTQDQGRSVRESAELKLYAALLFDAICCARGCAYVADGRSGHRGRMQKAALAREARRWINGEPSRGVTYQHVCDALGIHPGKLRAALARTTNLELPTTRALRGMPDSRTMPNASRHAYRPHAGRGHKRITHA